MKTPTQEQLNSVEWWDERAGTATYYCTDINQFLDYNRHYALSGATCCIPRPQPTDAKRRQEWVDGLPPVGVTCEVEDPSTGYWNRITVTAVGQNKLLAKSETFPNEFALNLTCRFRPLKTDAEREREEVIEAALACIDQDYSAQPSATISEYVENAVIQLYDAGMLRKGDNQ